MKKILVLDAFSAIHVGNGVLLDNSLRVCKDVYPDSEVVILSLDKDTSQKKYRDVHDDIFYDFPRNKGAIKKILWILNFFLFISLQLLNAKFFGFSSQRFCFNKTQKRLMSEIDSCDMCLSIAGETINDNFYPRLYQRCLIFWLAILKKKRLVVFPQSIGPIFRRVTKGILRLTLGKADLIVARDEKSYEVAKKVWDGCQAKVQYSPDVGVLQESGFVDAAERYFNNKKSVIGLTLSLVPKEIQCNVDYESEIVNALKSSINLDEYNILLMPSNYVKNGISGDYEICLRVMESLNSEGFTVSILKNEVIFEDEYQAIQKSLALFISTRMHVGILATTAGVPTIMINTQHKIKGYMKNIESENFVIEYDEISSKLSNMISRTLEVDGNNSYKQKLLEMNKKMKLKMKPFLEDFSKIF
ncbi:MULTISPECIES: polysaccharide pyruvyl transferase family protein [Shewanella]|uniref:Polysaccharide pyruvyl transferase family protein n=1 Tax=Shewanella marisflavi TaxID=260364 RepID=A0ABX5WMT5_9GAMM|nr:MULTISPECIES: polysaccharide pyruvyl transferase family protein [Shewanella]QDF75866.1 polysaccharide pyruvyl transferase family protein [Shewanella marisflavi]